MLDKIKEYLQESPILIPPIPGRSLIMYLIVIDGSMGGALGKQDETGIKEHDIYYLSKKFTIYKSRYALLEKTCCTLEWAAQHLKQYMLTHATWLISKMDPIKYIFEKLTLTGRVSHWHMFLFEYDIQYVTHKAMKGSVLSKIFPIN